MGVTQPAVSAQIKRLQQLLGGDLLDKSAPGVLLTSRGEMVLSHARRLLAINDEMLQWTSSQPAAETLRIGIPSDFAGGRVTAVLGRFRERNPNLKFDVRCGLPETMLKDLRRGDLDVVAGIASLEPEIAPRHWWSEEPVWIRSENTWIDPNGPVPLVSRRGECPFYRAATTALSQAGRDYELAFSSQSFVTLLSAVAIGFGPMVMLRSMVTLAYARNTWTELAIWEDAPLPRLPRLHCGVFIREGGNRDLVGDLADEIAATLQSPPEQVERQMRALGVRRARTVLSAAAPAG